MRISGIARCEDCQNNERPSTQQVKLRGNRRGVALPGRRFSCLQLKGITVLPLHCIAKSIFISLNSFTCSTWAVRLGTQQDKLRGNRRGSALRMALVMIAAQRCHENTISQHRKTYLNSTIFSWPRAFASPVLGKRNYRDKVWIRLNRQGMALWEYIAPWYRCA